MESKIQNNIHANPGIKNVVENKTVRETMISTFLELANILKGHCGPYSGTAILANPQNSMVEPVFTKDGINIISNIKYASVLQDFIRAQLAYMGTRIESGAGDGTTSAMIVMAYTLVNLLKYFEPSKGKKTDPYTLQDLVSTWRYLVDKVVFNYGEYKDYCVNLTDPEKIRHIAESQAYTSSHGDVTLAKCIGKLFSETPREVWDTLTVQKAAFESEEKYKVEIHDAQYTIDNVIVFPVNRRNIGIDDVGRIRRENVNCIIRNFLATGDNSQKFVHDYIEQCIKDGTPLSVITCNDMDQATTNHYSGLFTENPNHQVIFFMVPFEDGALNDINAIDMIRSMSYGQLDMSQLNIFQPSLECIGPSLRIKSGLFEDTLHNGLNPYYKNPDYPLYNKYIDHIRQIIAKEKSDVSRRNPRVVTKFIKILHKLISTKDVVFTVGGAAYDNAASQDIAMDALLATKCSLTEGCVCGGFSTLREVLEKNRDEEYETYYNFLGPRKAKLIDAYISALIDGIEQVHKAVESQLSYSMRKKIKGREFSPFDILMLDDPSYGVPNSFEEARDNIAEYCIIQPAMTDITFIKRFGEVGLKFLTANRIVAAGYYCDKKE